MSVTEEHLLTTESVIPWLLARGLVMPGADVQVEELGGGVSNIVLGVTSGRTSMVVKQSLPKLRVSDEWFAKTERVLTEADALRRAARLTPTAVPQVLGVDEERGAIVIDRAPASWSNFKQMLLAEQDGVAIAARCGEVLGVWHSRTWDSQEFASLFDDFEAFDQLRIDPYYRTTAARVPEVRERIDALIPAMLESRHALVHGDMSPKNILAGSAEVWVIDFEVAHFGDPAFDVAFMLNHLMLKAIHLPRSLAMYRRCSEAFVGSYAAVMGDRVGSQQHLVTHLGALMLARVAGKSPAEYLDERGRSVAATTAKGILGEDANDLDGAWQVVAEALA